MIQLGLTIDDKLTSKTHIEKICRVTKFKLGHYKGLENIYLTIGKVRINAFISCQFYYASLIWMLAGKTMISNIHSSIIEHFKQFLTLLRNHMMSSLYFAFHGYLESVNIFNTYFMWNYFNHKSITYDLRKRNLLNSPPAQSCKYGLNSLLFRGSNIWNSPCRSLKEGSSIKQFKKQLKCLGNLPCNLPILTS